MYVITINTRSFIFTNSISAVINVCEEAFIGLRYIKMKCICKETFGILYDI